VPRARGALQKQTPIGSVDPYALKIPRPKGGNAQSRQTMHPGRTGATHRYRAFAVWLPLAPPKWLPPPPPLTNQISRRQSSGSGVVVDSSGYIITNAHVIQGAINLKVLAASPGPSGAESRKNLRPAPVDAKVLGIDRESDLALLKIEVEIRRCRMR
jgi:S1-C subfamily serine protease